jgi:hypothetical protein
MRNPDILPVNFTISAAAKTEIENLKRFWDAKSLDTAAVAMIGWGIFTSNTGRRSENVVVSFYGKSQLAQIAHGVQEVSGLAIVFFTTAEHHSKFESKVIDHAEDQGFFLRDQ